LYSGVTKMTPAAALIAALRRSTDGACDPSSSWL
jgi:hypothetical protein